MKNIFTPKKVIKSLWLLFGLGFSSFILLFLTVYFNWFGWFGEIPDFEILENPKSELASEIYSDDGVIMGKYFRTNRSRAEFNEIDKDVIKALIATEDARFIEHSGVDFRATLRVLTSLGGAGGGSTISQQLAKNLFKMREDSIYKIRVGGSLNMIGTKIKEWITAKRLETQYTKKEIITMYLNTVDFGRNAVGIKSAAKVFFNKEVSDLTVQEAAILVGKLKATYRYDPIAHPERALTRRNTVLHQMTKFGATINTKYLSMEAYDSIKVLPIELNYKPDNYHSGVGAYFRAYLKNKLRSIKELDGYNINTDGLKIYTTINYKLQQYAEQSATEHMKFLQSKFDAEWNKGEPWKKGYIERKIKSTPEYQEYLDQYGEGSDSINIMLNKPRKTQVYSFTGSRDTILSPIDELKYHSKFLRCALLSIDPHSGEMKAWVGGINHTHFSYDNVAQGSRQVGSTFKPIAYSAAINAGYSPCQRVLDAPVTISFAGKAWTPTRKNPTGKMVTLKWAMAKSINNIAAWTMDKIGPSHVINHAKQLGIECELDSAMSLVLGTSNIPLKQMASAYCTFVDSGYYRTPICIKRIEDKNGKILYTPKTEIRSAMSADNAYKMITMLRFGTQNGTSRRLQTDYKLLEQGNQIGGKTGTTQNSADGWFIGVSKDLVTAVWVGGEEPHIHFKSGYYGQGARMAMPIFGKYMISSYKDPQTLIKKGPFHVPYSISAEDVVCDPETPILPESEVSEEE